MAPVDGDWKIIFSECVSAITNINYFISAMTKQVASKVIYFQYYYTTA